MHEMMVMKMMEGPDQLSSSSHGIPWIEEEELKQVVVLGIKQYILQLPNWICSSLEPWDPINFIKHTHNYNFLSLTFIRHSIKRREEKRRKRMWCACDPTAFMFPHIYMSLSPLFDPSPSKFWLKPNSQNCLLLTFDESYFFGLIMFRS